ncbi:para [Symbiodinium natans]|uniref:Para protein n=1 Tax=Symbiodinium natans TaxID=878477 RepID=A0A812NTY0_9DINO|nr:para [Symbiodinium natans]
MLKAALQQYPIEWGLSSSECETATPQHELLGSGSEDSAVADSVAEGFYVYGGDMKTQKPKFRPPPGLGISGNSGPAILATIPDLANSTSPRNRTSKLPPSIATTMDVEQKRLNAEIVEAGKAPAADVWSRILGLAEAHLGSMNAINISTALHRLARASTSDASKKRRRHPVLFRMLDVAEAFAERQLQNRDKSMSANVSTILAWSCASLHLFRSSLFAALLKVASRGVAECQSYEMTNLMWAVAELCRRHADMGQEIKPAIRELVLCATPVVLKWHLDTFNLKVLTSALMSLVHFPPMDGLDHKVLISKIVLELAVRDEELASENKVIASAFHAMCKQHPQIYRDVVAVAAVNCAVKNLSQANCHIDALELFLAALKFVERVDRSRRRSGGIAKDEELKMIRKRLAEYNERTSSVLGGRLDLACDKEPSLGCLVTSPFFDAIAAFVILFNSFVVGWEVEWDAANSQENSVIQVLSSFCNFFFLLEVLLRISYFRCDFFINRERRAWNIFDLILVVLAVVDEIAVFTLGSDASSKGAVGAAKMLKMLRILRVFRVFRFFRPLARLALMIMDSIRSLLWAMFMLALITYVFAVSLTAQASLWLSEQVDTSQPGWYASLAEHSSPEVRKIHSSFGSLSWTLYTLAQTALAGVSWHEVCDPLLQVGWLPVSLLLIYISFTLLAVLNVITGVFVDNAFRSADKQHSDIIQKEVDKKEECISLIQAFFKAVDVNHNGEISLDELGFFLDDATMEAFFRTLGFDVYDKHRFMELLDVDDSGEVSYEEFLEGCMRYRGVAQGVDVHTVIRHLGRLQNSVSALHEDLAELKSPSKPWLFSVAGAGGGTVPMRMQRPVVGL